MDLVLWILLIVMTALLVFHLRVDSYKPLEPFVNMGGTVAGLNLMDMSTQALDSAPTTSEVKNHYKTLLLYAADDIQKQGNNGLRILADFRDRVYARPNFRDDLAVEDFLSNWPSWLPPIDTTISEPAPAKEDAVAAEARMLAYLQKNYPQEDMVDDQTGSTIRNLIEDFGYRFVFKRGQETVTLPPTFLSVSLLKDWRNPTTNSGAR